MGFFYGHQSQSYAKNILYVHFIFHIEVQLLSILLKQWGGFYQSVEWLLPVSTWWVFINFIWSILDRGSCDRGCVSTSINRLVSTLFAWPVLQCQHFWLRLWKSHGKQWDKMAPSIESKFLVWNLFYLYFFAKFSLYGLSPSWLVCQCNAYLFSLVSLVWRLDGKFDSPTMEKISYWRLVGYTTNHERDQSNYSICHRGMIVISVFTKHFLSCGHYDGFWSSTSQMDVVFLL